MHISSRTLLVMVLGSLQFPKESLLKSQSDETFFEEMANTRLCISEEFLQKFGVHYTHEIFDWHKAVKYIKIEFPTEKNRDDWQEFFTMNPDGTFICKKSRLRDIWNEWYILQMCYTLREEMISYPLKKALAGVA